jgi:two-component system, OmpR family, response regulator MprA
MVTSRQQTVLLVDDDVHVRASVRDSLALAGHRVAEVGDGEEALEWLRSGRAQLVVLDVEMPRMDGWKTLEALRSRGDSVPVLMMTQVDDIPSRVRGLQSGADDYLGKPFAMPELVARVAALLRRPAPPEQKTTLQLGSIFIDLEKKTASRAGKSLRLTGTEYTLLELLHRAEGKPVSRETMLKELWGVETANSHTIDTHLWRLRRKLNEAPSGADCIKNLPGMGYVLDYGNASADGLVKRRGH